jgi:gamma-glutamylcyclotransferase (GGCT)/AIG2-like uncharacterized protein YtfP
VKDFLFSYGTLHPQHAPKEIAAATAKLSPYARGWVHGRLYDLGDYPGAVLDQETSSKIFGTVFEIPEDPAFLRRLDTYEGFNPEEPTGSLFIRRRHSVTLANGKRLRCWLYEYNGQPSLAQVVPSGRYQPAR